MGRPAKYLSTAERLTAQRQPKAHYAHTGKYVTLTSGFLSVVIEKRPL
jgi:hypothetical protein